MRSLCLKVPIDRGEKIRKKLLQLNILRKDLSIVSNHFLYLPISKKIDLGYTILEKDYKVTSKKIGSYKDIAKVPEKLISFLPSSFDIVGRIAILKIPERLLSYKKEIGDALLLAHKNLRTICMDKGVSERYRIRKLEVIAGEENMETTHIEYGVKLKLDLSKVYFSPRLANERWRVTNLVKDGETIVDMFAGVGSFSILIGKWRKTKKIYSIDINPIAIRYLMENIEINKISNIFPMKGDAKKLINRIKSPNRIIMNLPFSSYNFFEPAFKVLAPNGVIHYYEILKKSQMKDRIHGMENIARKNGYRIKTWDRVVKTYSATKLHFGIDVRKVK